jgi:two-component sensor histidine kinase
MADREVLVREIHHRSKNNLQIVSSLLRLAFDGTPNAEINRIVQESQDRIDAMARVHEQLYASQNLSEVDFGEYLRGLTLHLSGVHAESEQQRSIDFAADSILLPVDRAIPLGLWANEAITNSYRHAQGADRLTVHLESHDSQIELLIADNGPGVPPDHELLTGPQKKAGGRLHLGTYLLHDLPRQLGGTLSVKSDSGLYLSVSLPTRKEYPQGQ